MTTERAWSGVAWALLGVALIAACSGAEKGAPTPGGAAGDGGEPPAHAGGATGALTGGSTAGGTGSGAGASKGGEGPINGGGEAAAGGAENGGASAGSGGFDDGGAGGAGEPFVPGLCQVDEPLVPSVLASCAASEHDSECVECLKLEACDAYRVCYGTQPATACSTGPDEASAGQFECIVDCFAQGAATAIDPDELLVDCAEQCAGCPGDLVNEETSTLVDSANDPAKCQAQCFPFD